MVDVVRQEELRDLKRIEPISLDQLVKNQMKQPSITALPVWHKGYRFRSRLEGRWGVFFESIGIEFEYEPQGFKLENDVCYLPDFWLPVTRTYAEIKPSDPTAEEKRKCELTVMGTGGLFLILSGTPDFRSYPGVSRDAGELTEATYSLDIHANFKAYFQEHRFWAFPAPCTLEEEFCSDRYREAVYAARGARFDGKDLPRPGHEAFNPSDRDMGGAW